MGMPRPEQSQAWIQAYGRCELVLSIEPLSDRLGIHIKVQKEDLDKIGKTSIAMADGSGYLASLDVFHQLHCVYV